MKFQEIRDPKIIWVSSLAIDELNKLSSIELKKISPYPTRSRELLLLFLSFLTKGYYKSKKGDSPWVSLMAKHLRSNVGKNYDEVINLLKRKRIIEEFSFYTPNHQSRKYTLTDHYLDSTIQKYTLTDKITIRKVNVRYKNAIEESIKNPIVNYLIKVVYPRISFPDSKELLRIGQQHVAYGKTTPKGKILVTQNNFKGKIDHNKYRAIEDDIELFRTLTQGGLSFPTVGNSRSGGRIYDSLVLMSKWTRNTLKIDGFDLIELDFACLHPNIANTLYNNGSDGVTHEEAAQYLGISRKEAKNEHLSFFNLKTEQMTKNKLYPFYKEKFPILINEVIAMKNAFGYKRVSMDLFKKEVELMTIIIKELSEQNIPAIYVYDALMVKETDRNIVREIMNKSALKLNIKTSVK